MRLGIVSDSHGNIEALQKAAGKMGPVSVLIHAGDFYEDALELARLTGLPGSALKAVRGNCDISRRGQQEELFSAGGVRVYLTHGHRYEVKRSLEKLCRRAKEVRARVVVFGHSHLASLLWRDDILFVNPGSVCLPRGNSAGSCAVLEINENELLSDKRRLSAALLYLD